MAKTREGSAQDPCDSDGANLDEYIKMGIMETSMLVNSYVYSNIYIAFPINEVCGGPVQD